MAEMQRFAASLALDGGNLPTAKKWLRRTTAGWRGAARTLVDEVRAVCGSLGAEPPLCALMRAPLL
jgi:hypothetical protein